MTTVKIRIPEALKACIAASAERAGTTAHSFILEVVAEKVEQEERRADFLAEAHLPAFTSMYRIWNTMSSGKLNQAASALARCPRSRFSISASKNASSKLCAAFSLGSQWV